MNPQKQDRFNYLVFGSILYIFLFLLITNILFPPQSDDFDAYFSSLGGIHSAIQSYLGWNARFGDFIYLAFLAKYNMTIYFDVFVSLLGSGFFISFFYLLFGRLPKYRLDALILFLMLFFVLFFSAFGSDFLWGSGILNNLFSVFMIMLFLIPYRMFWSQYFQKKLEIKNFSFFGNILFFLLSFFAGWGTELGGIVSLVAQVCFLFFAVFIAKIKLPSWYYLGIIGFLLGYCVLYFSPGPRVRALSTPEFLTIANFLKLSFIDKMRRIYLTINSYYSEVFLISFLSILLYFFIKMLKSKNNKMSLFVGFVFFFLILLRVFLPHLFFVFVCLCGLLFFCFYLDKKKDEDFKFLFIIFLIYCFWLVGGGALMQVLSIPKRTKLFPYLLLFAIMIFSFIKIYHLLNFKQKAYLASFVVGISIFYSIFVQMEYLKHRIRWENMIAYIEQEKLKGNKHIVVDGRVFQSRYKHFGDYANPGTDPNKWPNDVYARYFGVDSFQISDSKERILGD